MNRCLNTLSRDGELWQYIGGSPFFYDMKPSILLDVIVGAGPFVRELNLRGHKNLSPQDSLAISKEVKQLTFVSLEQNGHFDHNALTHLLRGNPSLKFLAATGTFAFTNATCFTVSVTCRDLVMLDVSHCKMVTADGVFDVLKSCTKIKDLNISSLRGVEDHKFLVALHDILPNLTRLIMAFCVDLTDTSIRVLRTGSTDPIPADPISGELATSTLHLRHLNLSYCTQLTNRAMKDLAGMFPEISELEIAGLRSIGDRGLKSLFKTTRRLRYLDCDQVGNVGNPTLAYLSCYCKRLEHASFSYCVNITDEGIILLLRSAPLLRNLDLDNTRVTDAVLETAADVTRARITKALTERSNDEVLTYSSGVLLHITVYDCSNITWYGVLTIMRRNMERVAVSASGIPSARDRRAHETLYYIDRAVPDTQVAPDETPPRIPVCQLSFRDNYLREDMRLVSAGQIYVHFPFVYESIFLRHLSFVHGQRPPDYVRAAALTMDWATYCAGQNSNAYFGFRRYVQHAMLSTPNICIMGFESWIHNHPSIASAMGFDVDEVLLGSNLVTPPPSPAQSIHELAMGTASPPALQRRLSQFVAHGLTPKRSLSVRQIGDALREYIVATGDNSESESTLEAVFRETFIDERLNEVINPDADGYANQNAADDGGGEGGGGVAEGGFSRRSSSLCVIT